MSERAPRQKGDRPLLLSADLEPKPSHIAENRDALILKADDKALLVVLKLQDLLDLEVRP